MEVVVTTGAVRRSKLMSRHHQRTNTQLFYRSDALPVAQIYALCFKIQNRVADRFKWGLFRGQRSAATKSGSRVAATEWSHGRRVMLSASARSC